MCAFQASAHSRPTMVRALHKSLKVSALNIWRNQRSCCRPVFLNELKKSALIYFHIHRRADSIVKCNTCHPVWLADAKNTQPEVFDSFTQKDSRLWPIWSSEKTDGQGMAQVLGNGLRA